MQRPGPVLIGLGVAIALSSALIDVFGIGKSGFGWHQIAGIGVGVVVIVVGIVLATRQPDGPSEPGPPAQ